MIHALGSHLWQSTLFAAVAALLTLAFRANKAQVRYCLWLSASLKFLVPFALLTSLGNHIQTWVPSPARRIANATPSLSYTVDRLSQPPFSQGPLPVPASTRPDRIGLVTTGVWLGGALCLVLFRLLRWRRIQFVVRTSVPADIPAPVEIRLSPGLLEPAVVGSMRPVLLLPQGIAERLTPAEMNAVLDHELCHVRRRDNLLAWTHMIVETIFWFHPLVWWIGARLLDERERACDEDVVGRGHHPDVYAEAILNVCRLYAESPLPCVSGVTGSNLRKRIESIMSNRSAQRLNRARRVALGTAAIAAVAIPVLIGFVRPPVIRAQAQTSLDWQTAAGGPMSFEVASVKPDNGPYREPNVPLDLTSGNAWPKPTTRFSADSGLITYIEFAYKTRFTQQQIQTMRAQLPKWIFTQWYDDGPGRYAIEARSSTIPTKDQIRLMMQSLLAERFQLKVHFEIQKTEVLALTPLKPGKTGPKLRPHSEGPPCNRFYGPQTQGGKPFDASVYPPMCEITMGTERPGGMFRIGARNIPMAQLLEAFYGSFDRPLIDQTGITGNVDYQVDFSLQPGPPAPPDTNQPPPDPATALTDALREQLGLKLVPVKAELRVLVIDHVKQPSEN